MIFDYLTAERWAIAAVLILVGLFAIKILCVIIKKTLGKTALDPLLHRFIVKGFAISCGIVLVGTVLSLNGVPVTTIVTMLGVAGAAVALALKDSLGNVAGGLIIIISKPFNKGDMIETNGVVGQVDQIDLIFTTLLTTDNKVIYIPNGKLSTSVIVNSSSDSERNI